MTVPHCRLIMVGVHGRLDVILNCPPSHSPISLSLPVLVDTLSGG